jgi:hypothetical protein
MERERRCKSKVDEENRRKRLFAVCRSLNIYEVLKMCKPSKKLIGFGLHFFVKISLISQRRAGQPKFEFQIKQDATNAHRMIPKTNARYAVYVWEHYTKSQNIYGFKVPQSLQRIQKHLLSLTSFYR